jgi:hypothetical protein
MSNIGNKGEAIRRTTVARTTGGVVRIIDLDHPDSPVKRTGEARWAVACEHDLYVEASDLRAASAVTVHPETWCDDCRDLAAARGYVV